MTLEIGLTFGILIIAVILFITEILRVDLVALGVLVALTLTGLVEPSQAISGFSNPAVITIWAMFILSAGLSHTGIANMIGKQVMRLSGKGHARMVAVLMSITSLLSAFMNNIAVAALFLPITMVIARRTKRPPSQLLIPMAYGSLLGGLLLLIGTASNLLVRDAMREAGLELFGFFDFTICGLIIVTACVAYMALFGRRFLPMREAPGPLAAADHANGRDVHAVYGLEERLAWLVLPHDSSLAGKTLSESRIGLALGLNVLNIQRQHGEPIPPEVNTVLEGGDRLLILGRLDRINQIAAHPMLHIEKSIPTISRLLCRDIGLAEIQITEQTPFPNKTLVNLHMRQKYGVNVLAIQHGEIIRRTNFQNITLTTGDKLLLQGHLDHLKAMQNQPGFRFLHNDDVHTYYLHERLLLVSIPAESALIGQTLEESQLGAAFGLAALSINQGEDHWEMPEPETILQGGDTLVIGGRPQDIEVLKGLSILQVDRQGTVNLEALSSGPMQIIEVMLSPFTSLTGKTLKDIHFREKYGISVLAIWRSDHAIRTALGDIPLNYGDALLCYGPLPSFEMLARDGDFVVLKTEVQVKPRVDKAPVSALIMLTVILSVIILNIPISIAGIAGVVMMVVTGCLTMDEAYQSIDWRAVFLIAAMLPLGLTMQKTGASAYLAGLVIDLVGGLGPTFLLASLMILSMTATLVVPTVVVAVIMSPITLSAAINLGVSPYPFMMGIAYAIASAFLSPVSHPANVLVMSPGSYRATDYFKQGLPLSIIVLLISLVILPLLFPF